MTAYLDHAATAPPRRESVEAMLPYLTDRFGNPSGMHSVARAARTAIDEARDEMAELLGAEPSEIVFTGGGTEADNLALMGAYAAGNGTMLCSAIEHHAVLRVAEALDGGIVPVTSDGVVDLDALEHMLDPSIAVVSVMLVNNETGVVQPLHKVRRSIDRLAPNAVLHSDAVQATPWLDMPRFGQFADMLTISAHKFGGPQGVGALVVRKGIRLSPLLRGGGQERERRSGTHNVAGIVGMAAALRAATDERERVVGRVTALRDRLVDTLLATVPDSFETGPRALKVAGNAHLCFPGIESEALLVLLDEQGLCASAGASCSSGAMEPSHVLTAMGIDNRTAMSSVRMTLGHTTTDYDVDVALKVVPDAVARLREQEQ
jgi:cysteine desulfurase